MSALPVFLVLGVLALVSAVGRRGGRGASAASSVHEDPRWTSVRDVVRRARSGEASPEDLFAAAELAEQLGALALAGRLTRLALSLTAPADDVDEEPDEASPRDEPAAAAPIEDAPAPAPIDPARASTPPPASPPPGLTRSPLPEASDPAWRRFVSVIGDGKSNSVTPNYHLGIFRQGARKLVDLGVMTNPRRGRPAAVGDYSGDRDVWIGDWVAPYSLERFLSDPGLQLQLFRHDVGKLRSLVLQRHRDAIGQPRDGKIITLSGLIAVALRTGSKGLGDWLSTKRAVDNTTRAFVEATGLF